MFTKALRTAATEIVNDARSEIDSLHRQLSEIEGKKLEINEKLDTANLSLKRLSKFEPTVDGQPQCPWCWITGEIPITLKNPQGDLFDCPICGFHIEIDPMS